MDKYNWTYKKLKDVATIVGGSTPKTSEPENWVGRNQWVSPAELDGTKYFGRTERCISDAAAQKLTLLPVGTVLFSSRAPIGKLAITTTPMYCNQGFKNVVCGPDLYNEYVYWCLKYNVPAIQALGVGATFKEVSKTIVENYSIPVPPLPVQDAIVAELDAIHSILDKKNEQLKELDALAQAIFYDMFGDPITNEKGWPFEELGNQIKVQGGYAFKSSDYCNNGVRLVQISNVNFETLNWDTTVCVPSSYLEGSAYSLKTGDILMAMTRPIIKSLDTVKVVRVTERDLPCLLNQRVCRFIFTTDQINTSWFLHFLRLRYFKDKVEFYSSNALQPNVSGRDIERILMYLPPLSLQQEFAAKVEAIEAQKETIRKSIREVETLLAQTMDKYFG